MKLTEEEVDVIREAIDCFLAKKPPKGWDGKQLKWNREALRTRSIAEELYSRLRVDLAA